MALRACVSWKSSLAGNCAGKNSQVVSMIPVARRNVLDELKCTRTTEKLVTGDSVTFNFFSGATSPPSSAWDIFTVPRPLIEKQNVLLFLIGRVSPWLEESNNPSVYYYPSRTFSLRRSVTNSLQTLATCWISLSHTIFPPFLKVTLKNKWCTPFSYKIQIWIFLKLTWLLFRNL